VVAVLVVDVGAASVCEAECKTIVQWLRGEADLQLLVPPPPLPTRTRVRLITDYEVMRLKMRTDQSWNMFCNV
jgi:hypothetical protein